MMLKAVFWDMDGTLIDSEPYWHAGEMQIAHENGGVWNDELMERLGPPGAGCGARDRGARVHAAGGGDRPAHDRIRDAGGI